MKKRQVLLPFYKKNIIWNNMSEEKNIPPEEIPQEQPVNKESADETLSSAEPVTESEQLITHNSELIPSDMEVHKHPHHVTHKKKWGEYLLEFLMLFLAVFLGFVAENIREHVIEQNRAKEFSASLMQDLKNDTAAIDKQKRSTGIYLAVVDSLLKLDSMPLAGRNAAQFSFYTRFTYWTFPISWNRNTFEQVKNSGSLRYFKNDQLLNKMLEYDAVINDIRSEAEANKIRGNLLLPQINYIIEPAFHHELSKHFLAALDTMSTQTRERLFSYKTGSLENKREKINELLNMVVVQQRNLRLAMEGNWEKARVLAIELISDLKNEYHLENE